MVFRKRRSVPPKTVGELDAMEAAGRIVGIALQEVRAAARPGVSTLELDRVAEDVIRDHGAIPTFLGYNGFPASICASINEVVVHGIPSATEVLKDGDLVSIDCGATLDGWVGDSAWSFGVGQLPGDVDKLNRATEWVLGEGLKAMVPGARLTDVSHALEVATRAAERRFGIELGILDGYGGHGIGHEMHEEPFLANEGRAGRGPLIAEGSVLAIEPMLILGGETESEELDDGWTVVTLDRSPAAHWEHTVAATSDGPRILTPRVR
ncbi:Methionine aminopeptidase 1 [Corynebacterium capitovis DSM 44611]|uniref:type I methionyl aminopeptidase n=1 Tax=Corynebacterium capitovis TaxID=131081 RepID=UPI000374E56D|nr:type I methionyl aminopeptidase [Corynebacterium capitovis]WKD56876.1 Methionine aminopeptidase 1 [Corynebacterium capitovis DSM 44611]